MEMNLHVLHSLAALGILQLIGWFRQHHLLRSHMRCPTCRRDMREEMDPGLVDGCVWRCPQARCRRKRAIRYGSFFENSHLTLVDHLHLLFSWSFKLPNRATVGCCKISEKTVGEWFHMIREVCSVKLMNLPPSDAMLGGPGVIVSIDESVLVKRKYNAGREGNNLTWVFGMYDTARHVGRIERVPDRNTETLFPIIQKWTRPDSIIHSDGWAAYKAIQTALGSDNETVDHARNFVSPVTGAHTQHVKGYWLRAKRKLKAVNGSSGDLLWNYMEEFMWRERFGKNFEDAFTNIVLHISEQYP